MPFRFRLRKARRYNVSSKNSYVVCVHLLDNTLIECTLTSESSGQECLDNIAQRIELSQTESFGLRYVNRRLEQRWVELHKPLRRQLDKYAHSPLLYLGVMCYAMDVHRIADEMTRYQYYLQLKADVIDGRLSCTAAVAVLLASYSVQAEFGDHNYGQHTTEYLKDFMLLPRNMTSDEQTLATLTNEIVSTHRSLAGMAPAVAELQYIMLVQQLEGYGLEYYPAKDDHGNDILLGASFIGVFVKHLNDQPTVYFKWADIIKMSHNRKWFAIETTNHTVPFQAEDVHTLKYIFKMFLMKHAFYRTNEFASHSLTENGKASESGIIGAIPDIQLSTQISVPDVPDNVKPAKQVHMVVGTIGTPHQNVVSAEPVKLAAVTHIEPPPVPEADVAYQAQGGVYNMAVLPQGASHLATQRHASSTSLLLPAYRCSPSYQAVMARRGMQLAEVYAHTGALACSQPEIRTLHTPPSYAQYMQRCAVERTCSLIIYPTFSTPADNTPLEAIPPLLAYPITTSTPDLARGATPDLHLISQSRFDQSVDNLTLDAHRLQLGQRAAAGSKCATDDDMSVASDGVRRSPSPDHEYLITDPPNDAAPDYPYLEARTITPVAYNQHVDPGFEVPQGHILSPDLLEANGGVAMSPEVAALNDVFDYTVVKNQNPKDERLRTLETRLLTGQVFSEFEAVPKCRTRWSCDIAEHELNAARNRFQDVLPYDDSRVHIAKSPKNPAGYINASHLHMTVASEEWRYIVTQAPLPNTVTDFWQMVWNQGVQVISMLTTVTEGGKVKCEQYWPQLPGVENKLSFGDLTVSLQFSSSCSSYRTTGLCVQHLSAGQVEERLVWHLQYTGWPDHGCPQNPADFLAYLDEFESVRRHVASELGGAQPAPTLVHCSAGVGRSGVVILSEIIKACLEHNQEIDVPGVLHMMREQRMHLVQTISQYRFIYSILVEYLSRSRLI